DLLPLRQYGRWIDDGFQQATPDQVTPVRFRLTVLTLPEVVSRLGEVPQVQPLAQLLALADEEFDDRLVLGGRQVLPAFSREGPHEGHDLLVRGLVLDHRDPAGQGLTEMVVLQRQVADADDAAMEQNPLAATRRPVCDRSGRARLASEGREQDL